MRHGKTVRKFGRVTKQRSALMRSLAVALINNKKITTTLAKAKELRPYVEKIITKGKVDSLAVRRHLQSHLDLKTIAVVITELSPKYKERNGGYTRITKLPTRTSDGAQMGIIEWVS